MFSWFRRRKPTPPPAPWVPTVPIGPQTPAAKASAPLPVPNGAATNAKAEPAKKPEMAAVRGRIGFANAQRSWSEEFDLIQITLRAFHQRGFELKAQDWWLEHESGLVIRPVMVFFQPLEPSGVRTTTTVETSHPSFPGGKVYEYQHSTGKTTEDSLFKGIDQWLHIDFPVFLDALEPAPKQCTLMELSIAATAAAPARQRRIILGPVAHLAQHRDEPAGGDQPHSSSCACCLLTNSWQAFKPYIEGDGFYGIRLFGMRDENGVPQADCRINGEEFEPGKAALRKYVERWPKRGFEFRKQYVILQDGMKASATDRQWPEASPTEGGGG